MPEVESLGAMLKQFGPYGVCLLLMGSGIIYLMRWLRDDRRSSDANHAAIRTEFLVALKDQRTDHTIALKEVTTDFKEAMNDQGKRIEVLGQKIDVIDGHIQNLRIGQR